MSVGLLNSMNPEMVRALCGFTPVYCVAGETGEVVEDLECVQ